MSEPNVENAKPVPIRIIKIEFAKFVELSPIFQDINCQIANALNKNTRKIIDEIVLIRPIFSISSSSKTSSSSGFSFLNFEMVNLLNSLSKVKIGIEIAKPIIREIPAAKPELSISEFEVVKNAAAEIPAKSVKIPIARQIALLEIREEYSFFVEFGAWFFRNFAEKFTRTDFENFTNFGDFVDLGKSFSAFPARNRLPRNANFFGELFLW